jgi:hypothetical protein
LAAGNLASGNKRVTDEESLAPRWTRWFSTSRSRARSEQAISLKPVILPSAISHHMPSVEYIAKHLSMFLGGSLKTEPGNIQFYVYW